MGAGAPRRDVVFAWRPVRLAEYRTPHWHLTGERACWVRVERIRTYWGDVFYRRLDSGAKPCPHPGCKLTDGQPCAYAQCPNRKTAP